jgi:CheY-like chemotaxis protein
MASLPHNLPAPAYVPKSHAGCVLSVDDELDILFTRQAVLETAGYKVLSAAGGRQALESFEAHRVDLVVLDYRMPEMDGAEVAREMKRRKPQVPVILLEGGLVDRESRACVDCLLCKGESPEFLLQEIDRLLATFQLPPRSESGI